MSNFTDVGEFHEKFGLPHHGTLENLHAPQHIPADVAAYRLNFLQEELDELANAYMKDDLPGIADALVDLVYVALGTAHFHNLPWEALFREVQRANMTKERAASDASNSKRHSPFDVIKPKGWTPPDIKGVLVRHGWKP